MEGSVSAAPRRAGQYAAERHQRGLRSFRRRFYRQVGVTLVFVAVAELLLALYMDSFFSWIVFSFVAGGVVTSIWILRQLPPDHVRRWGDGAWGEQQTAKALEPLEQAGWTAEHDIELDRGGNIDHLVQSPKGKRFVLETKTLNGEIRVENGLLVCTQLDDHDQVYRHSRLRHAVLERARLLYRERPGGWVQGVVVIWGDFPQRRVENGKLAFVHGEELDPWLRERAS
jgi:hypothetical protein